MKETILNVLFFWLFYTLACLGAILIGLGVHYIILNDAYKWFIYPPIGGICIIGVGYFSSWIENRHKDGGQ